MEWPIGNDGLHSECRKAKEPQTVLSAELVSTFSSSALLCIQNSPQLSLTTRATSPDYLSSASWMPTAAFSLKLSLPVRKIISTQWSPPCQFHLHLFHAGRPSHPRLLRPSDPEILLPKYSNTLRSYVSEPLSPKTLRPSELENINHSIMCGARPYSMHLILKRKELRKGWSCHTVDAIPVTPVHPKGVFRWFPETAFFWIFHRHFGWERRNHQVCTVCRVNTAQFLLIVLSHSLNPR